MLSISSIFSSLVEPAFRATISDLLAEEAYSKASGLVQLTGFARFLISPLVAGALLAVSDIKLLLIIDICTIFLTVLSTLVVRKGLDSKIIENAGSIISAFKIGWSALTKSRGVFILTLTGIGISFFLGGIQSLYTPMLLSFTDSSVLGTTITICASGMLVSSILIGSIPIKKNFVKIMSGSLFLAGIFMEGFGFRENILLICIFGFLFLQCFHQPTLV